MTADPTTPRPTDAAIALVAEAAAAVWPEDFPMGVPESIATAILAHPTLARVIAIGQAWVAAEEAVLGRGAGIEMTVRTLPGAGAVASWYDRVDGEGDRLPSEPTPEAALLALAAALTDQERGS